MSVRDVSKGNPYVGQPIEKLEVFYREITAYGTVISEVEWQRMRLIKEAIILERDRLMLEAIRKAASCLEETNEGPKSV